MHASAAVGEGVTGVAEKTGAIVVKVAVGAALLLGADPLLAGAPVGMLQADTANIMKMTIKTSIFLVADMVRLSFGY